MLKEVSLADLPSYISLSQGFLSIMALWGAIWNARNDLIFRRIVPNLFKILNHAANGIQLHPPTLVTRVEKHDSTISSNFLSKSVCIIISCDADFSNV